jgi:hypothetical protein
VPSAMPTPLEPATLAAGEQPPYDEDAT